jgi:hypothetical protein
LGDKVVFPYCMLLVHNVTADDASIIVDNHSTITTFADRSYYTLRNTTVVVSIAKFKEQLLCML